MSWYGVENLGPELTCPLCHERISVLSAVDTENKGAWHLKTAGPFSVPNYADGSYTVLLAHGLFQRFRSLQTTPALSFTATSSTGEELEADYAMLWREDARGETLEGVLFAECKSYNEFEKRDFVRMKELAKRFPNSL